MLLREVNPINNIIMVRNGAFTAVEEGIHERAGCVSRQPAKPRTCSIGRGLCGQRLEGCMMKYNILEFKLIVLPGNLLYKKLSYFMFW